MDYIIGFAGTALIVIGIVTDHMGIACGGAVISLIALGAITGKGG